MRGVKYAHLLLYLLVLKSSSQFPLQRESPSFFMSEVRVKRQAGYVYDRPSVSFDLPSRAPTSITQAPTVDRIQAQMMYYAYPAPASGDTVNIGVSSGTTAGSRTASSGTASAGYNYGSQNTISAGSQPTSAAESFAAVQTNSASSSGSSGYGYNAPSVGTALTSSTSSAVSTQAALSGPSQTVSSPGSSGYAYNAPTIPQPGTEATAEVSTNAPKYLPPTSIGVSVNDGSGSISGAVTSGAVAGGSGAGAPPLDQYLPPITQTNPSPPSVAPSSPSINVDTQSGFVASSGYIPPVQAPLSVSVMNTTPRPFSPASLPTAYLPPASLPTAYLPPIVNSGSPTQSSVSTPASTYLPPVL